MSDRRALRILWLATKPPWPPTDGGRLLMDLTLQALLARGQRITVVAPAVCPVGTAPAGVRSIWVKATPRPRAMALLDSVRTGLPLTTVRHRLPAVRRAVAELCRLRPSDFDSGFDVVHVEQAQALSHLPEGFSGPVVLRAQNVESALWQEAARHARAPRAWLLEHQARRLAAWEAESLRRPTRVVALTEEDAARLSDLSGRFVEWLPAPFPTALAHGDTMLAGEPALVVLGSAGWLPNRDGLRWLLSELWPPVEQEYPLCRLHLFGAPPPGVLAGASSRIVVHPPPQQSADAFCTSAILLVPLRIASGVRMKILEAFARGVPVIATPQAAAGLGVLHRVHLYLAENPAELGAALAALRDPSERARISAQARALLRERHRPERVAERLLEVYCGAAERAATAGG